LAELSSGNCVERGGSTSLLLGYGRVMTCDPRRVVDDLEAKIIDEEGVIEAAGGPSAAVAEDTSPDTPGVEPTD